MSSAVQSSIRLSGTHEVAQMLGNLKKDIRTKVLAYATRRAARPVIDMMRSLAPQQTGLLRKSLGVRVKTYGRSGVTVAVIGPRSGFKQETPHGPRNPVKYAHLVEGGTRPHLMKTLKLPNGRVVRLSWWHPGSSARPFVGPASASYPRAAQAFEQAVLDGFRKYTR